MITFRTKRERRKQLLSELTAEEWRAKRKELFWHNYTLVRSDQADDTGQLGELEGKELEAKTNDFRWRINATHAALDRAEENEVYGNRLDRAIGLRTDGEEQEYHAWWTAGRNKAFVVFGFLSLIISIVALRSCSG